MKYLIYEIVNQINGKYYVGQHKTADVNDGYMGSGKLVKRAIKKYGAKNFSKEILFVCRSLVEMNNKEKELVTAELINDPMCYNIAPGGNGGYLIEHKTLEEKDAINKAISNTLLTKSAEQKEISLQKRNKTVSTRTQKEQDAITTKRLKSFSSSMRNRSVESKRITSQRIADSWNNKTEKERATTRAKHSKRAQRIHSTRNVTEKDLINEKIRNAWNNKTQEELDSITEKRLATINDRTQKEQDAINKKRNKAFTETIAKRTQEEQTAIKMRLSWFNNGIVARRYTPGTEPAGFCRGRKLEKQL